MMAARGWWVSLSSQASAGVVIELVSLGVNVAEYSANRKYKKPPPYINDGIADLYYDR